MSERKPSLAWNSDSPTASEAKLVLVLTCVCRSMPDHMSTDVLMLLEPYRFPVGNPIFRPLISQKPLVTSRSYVSPITQSYITVRYVSLAGQRGKIL